MEMSEIANDSFLPLSCMEGDVPNFYKELAKHEDISASYTTRRLRLARN